MLIIVCGSEGIHKKFLTRKILAATNNFTIQDYILDFNTYPFRILDATGNLVYQSISKATNKFSYSDQITFNENDMNPTAFGKGIDILCNTTFGKSIVKQALKIEQQYFLDGIKYYRDVFANHALDYKLLSLDVDSDEDAKEKQSFYNDLIDTYNSSKLDNAVVCGSFGKTYVEKIAQSIGKENILVLNIIRHPSVSWCVHQKSDAYYNLHKSSNLEGREGDIEKFYESTLAAISIKDLDYVKNIKFEDIIHSGLEVLGNRVKLPVGYEAFNNYITEYEVNNVLTQGLANEDVIQDMNTQLSNFKQNESFDVSEVELPDDVNDYFPSNIFTELGYTPINYRDIVDKR